MNDVLNGHVVLVTGSGQGVGRALCLGLAQMGAHIWVTDVNEAAAQQTLALLTEQGGQGEAFGLDVADATACQGLAASVELPPNQRFALVNNAGVRPRHPFDSPERDKAWSDAMSINLEGARNTILAFQPLLEATQGSVVNIGSISASRASPGGISYSTSKAAVEMLTRVMAVELAGLGIRVNAVAPGVMETEMTAQSRANPKQHEYLMRRIPLKRYGRPEELCAPVAFLASPLSSYITGTVLSVDGGYLAA